MLTGSTRLGMGSPVYPPGCGAYAFPRLCQSNPRVPPCSKASSMITSRWREIRTCNNNACGESKSQNSHESLLDLTFVIAATDPKTLIY
jgi:hypothetical protein